MGRAIDDCKAGFEPPIPPVKPDGTACRCSTTRMGHVLAAAPGVERFHLVDRWLRELTARGHRTEVLCVDEADFVFWSAQGHASSFVAPETQAAAIADLRARMPLLEFAEIDCRRSNRPARGRPLRRAERRLVRLLPGLLRRFETDAPDLVLLHQRRTGVHAMVQFVAREFGVRILWTGDGLLPGTMQLDDGGLDGDARASRRSAWDFRSLPSEDGFLRAALSGVVGRNRPPGLTRRAVQRPAMLPLLRAAFRGRDEGTGQGFWEGFTCWRRAAPPENHPARTIEMPSGPFVAVLLQPRDYERVLLDAPSALSPLQLVSVVREAANLIDPRMPVVAVLPRDGIAERDLRPLRGKPGVVLELAHAEIEACLAATAVVTINAPHAAIALLADTPVIHLGRAVYGIPGVAVHSSLPDLAASLQRALQEDQPELRKRCLAWLFRHGHLWCDQDEPDYNGLCGLVMQVERRLERSAPLGTSLEYRAGPAWPLAAEGR